MRQQETREPAPNDNVRTTKQNTNPDPGRITLDDPPPSLWTYREISEEAKRRTIESGALEVTDSLLREVVGHAEAAARERYRGPFSPRTNAHDAIRQEEFEGQRTARTNLEQGRKFRLADLQDAETDLARTSQPGPAPTPSQWLVATALLVFAVSVAPTFRDFVFHGIQDDVIGWMLSIAVGSVLGGLVVTAVLFSIDPSGARTLLNFVGLGAGGAITVGLLVLRLSGAETASEVFAAIALAVIEAGAVVYVEVAAVGFRPRRRDWEARSIEHAQKTARRDDIRRHVAELDAEIAQLRDAMSAHARYVEERNVRHQSIEQVVAAAGKAAADGVAAGVAFNRGRLLGIRRPQ